jgi:phage/plasmid-associated DNA primase
LAVQDKEGLFKPSPTQSYANRVGMMSNMLKFLRCLPGVADPDWERRTSNSSLGKLLFRNGMLDATTGLFYHRDQFPFNPDIVFFARLNMDYEPLSEDDREYAQSIRQRIFANPLGEEAGQHMLLQLSRGLMGDCMKRFLLGLGVTNGGKSIISSAVLSACGNYAGTFNAESLSLRFNGGDEAQALRWLLLHRYKRLFFPNEVRSGGSSSSLSKKQRPQVFVDGNMLKKLSSGGDEITGRFHGGNETAFVFHGLATCFANDFPNIDPCDEAVSRRLHVFSFNKQFVSNPSNELQLLLDPNIK